MPHRTKRWPPPSGCTCSGTFTVLDGIQRAEGKTFRWACEYDANMIERTTLSTELGVFADFKPELPDNYLFFYNGIRWGNIIDGIPKWLDCGFTVFWIVGAINAFNLIDGLDGLASGLALIASLGLTISLISRNLISETIPFLALGGACLGFLRYNFNPASVFLGDTGSMFLGMTISTLPLLTGSSQELAVSLGMPLLVMGVPIFDTFLAIWRRSVRALLPNAHRGEIPNQGGGAVMQPDKDHLHHRLLRLLSNNQRKAALIDGSKCCRAGSKSPTPPPLRPPPG